VRELLQNLQADERIILESVFWAGTPSRHELLLSTGFSKTKLNEAVANLIASGWLEEGELQDSRGGRPPLGLSFAPKLGYVIGVDLGATRVDVILSNVALEPIEVCHASIDVRSGPGTVMPMISKLIADLLESHHLEPDQVLSLGFGMPSPIEFETGILINPILMAGWEGFSLRDYFASSLEVPVAVDNDVNVMALGELWHTRINAPAQDRHENFLVVKLGTGIGAGIVARGEIYRGADGAAGDIGHNCVDPHGPRCVCGNFGCLELWAGANSIIQSATEAGRNAQSPAIAILLEKNGLLRKPYLLEKPGITIEDVARAAREGDHASNEIIQDAGSRIGQVLAGLVNFFNPARILIGGRVARIGPLMLSSIRQSVYARSLPLSTRALRIDYTRLGNESGMRGACALALLEAIRRPDLARL
jgi:predicted NBD/HSP70 family sugar kinase